MKRSSVKKTKRAGKVTRSKSLRIEHAWLRNPLRKIFENSENVFSLTDRNGFYIYVSPSVKRIFGYSPKELVGMRGILKVHPEDRDIGTRALRQILKKGNGSSVRYELRANHKDGTWHWFEVVSQNLLNEPDILAVASHFHDITERKDAEERYRAFISHSTEGICRYELSVPVFTKWPVKKQVEHFLKYGKVAECNDTMAKMYGYGGSEELVGAPLTTFLDPRNKDHQAVVVKFITSGYSLYDAEICERDRFGNSKYFLINMIGVVEGDKGSRAWGTKRDITERKRIENLMKESEERFRNMADQAPVMMWLAGTNKLTYWFNKVWLDYTGRSMGHEIGNGWAESVHPDDLGRVFKVYASCFKERKPYRMEYRLRRFDGMYRWVLSNGLPRFSPDGTFEGFIGSCIDINEIHVAEQRKDEFIGIASHELKTPITTIKVYTQMLQKAVESGKISKAGEQLAKMDAQVDKLTKLISDLLDISKIQAGRLQFTPKPFKLDDLVKETSDMLQGSIKSHKLILSLQSKTLVRGDRDRIGQVLINLISNAVKYSPKAKRVVISTSVKSNKAIVQVEDFGIGISKEHRERVFDRFFRVEGNQERNFQGFGMGLYISSELVRRHGGEINVESTPGKGSIFSFTLPLVKGMKR